MAEKTTFELVRALSEGRAMSFSQLLELRGIPDSEQTAYIKRAESMSSAIVEMCRAYCVQVSQPDGKLFAAIAASMATDALLHTLITKEQSESITDIAPTHH